VDGAGFPPVQNSGQLTGLKKYQVHGLFPTSRVLSQLGVRMHLKGYQRGYLTRKAHPLQPIVHIGKLGITEEVVGAIDKALNDHELIKVKFVQLKQEREQVARSVSDRLQMTLVRVVGNIAIYYRHQTDAQKRVVHLPK
jgi:RNA-binding protein